MKGKIIILTYTSLMSLFSSNLIADDTSPATHNMGVSSIDPPVSQNLTVPPAPVATAPAQGTMEVESAKPSNMFPVAEQLSSSGLEKKRDDYLAKRGMVLGQNIKYNSQGVPVKQFYIGWGQANVSVSSTDIAFPDARVAAFEIALLTAKGEFVKSNRRQIASESMQRFFQDERDYDPQKIVANDNYYNRMKDKLSTLSEVKIDRLLKDVGEDPSKFGHKEKQLKAEESFQKTISVNALSSVAGVRALTTFEDLNSVGVIIVYSQKLQLQARDIARGKGIAKSQLIPGKRSILQQIDLAVGDGANYMFQHGVRVMTDEYGNPALVSFGQSGVKVTNTDSKFKIDMAVKAAKSASQGFASAQFAEFVNATVALEDKTQILTSTQINEVVEDGIVTEEQKTNVGKLINNYVKQNSRTTITGITTIKTWTANHPDTGHLVVGEVMLWSPFTRDAAKQKFNKPQTNLNKSKQGQPKNNMHQSTDFESEASF
ncbi:MAG: hypothetical protein ACJAWS_001359 [Oleiphilaceae bacterium]|jgi:hypothetical protein